MLDFLYNTIPGRALLKVLTCPGISKFCGYLLDRPISVMLIPGFIKRYAIKLSDYRYERYKCFNDFFCRKIKKSKRPVDNDTEHIIAPCDGLLSAYRIKKGTVIPVKASIYSIEELMDKDPFSKNYDDGICLVFRLCVDNYHRYCFVDNGKVIRKRFIPGVLHTVRPIALSSVPVFVRNSREYTVLDTENYGILTQIEIGAMLVGRIINHPVTKFLRGEEKGMFKYGGSTVILLLEKDSVPVSEEIFRFTEEGYEIPVHMGEKIW